MRIADLAQTLQRPVDEVLGILVRASRQDPYAVIEAPATQEQLAGLEQRLPVALHPLHLDFLRACNGGRFRCFSGGAMDWFGTHPREPRVYPGQHNKTPRLPEVGMQLPMAVQGGAAAGYVPFAVSGGTYFCYDVARCPAIVTVDEQGAVAGRAPDFAALIPDLDVRLNLPEYSRDALRRAAAQS